MSPHRPLEILDPTCRAPHDLYVILALLGGGSSGRSADAGQIRKVRAPALGHPAPSRFEPGRLEMPASFQAKEHRALLPRTASPRPKEFTDQEKKDRAAAWKAEKEAKAARSRERKAKMLASSVVKPGQDKDFAHLVYKAQEELGRYGQVKDHDRAPEYWFHKAVAVRDKLRWMQEQLIKEMRQDCVLFGTRRNALVAMREIMRAIVTDEMEIGENLRELWFDAMLNNFKKAIAPMTYGELDKLRQEGNGKWVRHMKRLIKEARGQDLPDALLKEILLTVEPKAGDSMESDGEGSADEGGTPEGKSDEDGDEED